MNSYMFASNVARQTAIDVALNSMLQYPAQPQIEAMQTGTHGSKVVDIIIINILFY